MPYFLTSTLFFLLGLGISRLYALTVPIGAGLFAAIMLTFAWKVLSGRGVTWKGRKYELSK